jgi:AcrR family transcriptional regulator
VAKGTVYLYFKSKPEILAHAIAVEKKQYMGVMREILAPDKTAAERLREWLRQLFVLGSKMPLTSKVLSGDPEVLAAIFEFMDHYKEQELTKMQMAFVCALLAEAGKPEPPEQTADKARVLLGLAFLAGKLSDEKLRGGLSIEQFADVFAGMLTDGLSRSK